MDTPPIIDHILRCEFAELARSTGFSHKFFCSVRKNWRQSNFRMYKNTLDELYKHFKLKPDDYYRRVIKKTENSTDAVLGNLFRARRILLGWSAEDVATRIKVSDREIKRIENGDVLPYECGYFISELLKLYHFEQEEEDLIRWHIVILRDMRSMAKKENEKINDMER